MGKSSNSSFGIIFIVFLALGGVIGCFVIHEKDQKQQKKKEKQSVQTTSKPAQTSATVPKNVVAEEKKPVPQLKKVKFEQGKHSKLWGVAGEKWDPMGRLPDFSYAGYHAGDKPIPNVKVVANIADFGAIPNDDKGDSAAFQKAVDTVSSGAILIPKGKYIIEDFINIKKSGIVFRGEGEGAEGTILYVPKSATEVAGKKNGGFATGGYGQFFVFEGRGAAAKIADITGEAKRGSHTVTVSDASRIKPGKYYFLEVKDNKLGGEFWKYLHKNKLHNWLNLVKWADAGHASLFKVTAVDGNKVTFREPLRYDIRPPWKVCLKEQNNISECGIENLRFEFPADVKAAPHLKEPGYNAVRFKKAHNCWIQDVTIANADNGVTCSYMSGFIDVRNVKLEGRRGHHGISLSGASNCLIVDLVDNCREPWIHTVTMDHKANGNVNKGTSGTNTVSLDFHRDAPYENLHTNIKAKWNYCSSGDPKAGPHCAARNTYWGLSGQSGEAGNPNHKGRDFLYRHWGKIQTNVVTDLKVPERFSEDEEWYEDLPELEPKDLHRAQLERRKNLK